MKYIVVCIMLVNGGALVFCIAKMLTGSHSSASYIILGVCAVLLIVIFRILIDMWKQKIWAW